VTPVDCLERHEKLLKLLGEIHPDSIVLRDWTTTRGARRREDGASDADEPMGRVETLEKAK
jgi:hypothetical protein